MFAMIGRLLGFLRETLIAATFGATAITDAYLTTLLLFDLAIAANVSFLQGSLAYSAGAENRDQFLTWLYKSGYKIALGIILCAAVLFPAIKYIMPLIFTHSPEATETMTISSQLFLFMAAFTTSSGLFSAILQIKGNLTNPGRLIVYLNTFSI